MSTESENTDDRHEWANSIPRELAGALSERDNDPVDRQVSQLTQEWLKTHENDAAVWDVINDALDRLNELALEDARAQDATPWVRIHRDLGPMGRFARPFFTTDDIRFEYQPRGAAVEGAAS